MRVEAKKRPRREDQASKEEGQGSRGRERAVVGWFWAAGVG